MNSLEIISDINNRITELDTKISRTSKGATVVFSYLNSKLDNLPDYQKEINEVNDKLTYLTYAVENNSYNIISNNERILDMSNQLIASDSNIKTNSSYIISLDNKLNNITTNTITKLNQNVSTVELKIKDIKTLSDRLNNLENKVNNLNKEITSIHEKLDKISLIPQNYILVTKETPKIVELFNNVKNFFYRVFHYRQIKKEKELQEELKRKQLEEEERIKKEKIKKQKEEELKRKSASYKKIQDLIK